MRKILITVIMLLCVVSCDSPQNAIRDLESLLNEIEANYQYYSDEDWDYITMRYDAIEEKLSTYQFTDEELKEIGRMKGKCLGYMTQESINNLEEEIRIFSKELEGGIEGFLEIFNNSNNE